MKLSHVVVVALLLSFFTPGFAQQTPPATPQKSDQQKDNPPAQKPNDVVKIDDEITVFTYRSFRDGFAGPAACVVSFTMKNKTVTTWKYEGGNCPRNKR